MLLGHHREAPRHPTTVNRTLEIHVLRLQERTEEILNHHHEEQEKPKLSDRIALAITRPRQGQINPTRARDREILQTNQARDRNKGGREKEMRNRGIISGGRPSSGTCC